LIVDQNLDLALLHHTNTGVGGAQINTNDGAVLRDIVRLDLLDEAQREEEGKEPNEAQAEGPAPRSTLHVESCVVKRREQTTTLFALLLAGGEKGVKK
jgi:hypothetical protein